MVAIIKSSEIEVSELTTVVDTAVTVGTTKLAACISRDTEAHYVIVYKGDRLVTVGQIKWAIRIAKDKDSYLTAQLLLNEFLCEQQQAERLLKPSVYTRTRQGSQSIQNTFFTVEAARRYFLTTLETGKAYSQEKGNKKINLFPTTVKALVNNLNNALNNAAANGWSGTSYSAES
ncbi:MAG: hypothetical protein RR280_01025 [Bacteroidaceae bacterium]